MTNPSEEAVLVSQYALVKDPRRMPRLVNHPDRVPPERRAGRTYVVSGKVGATVRAAASLRSPVVSTIEDGGKVDVVEERRDGARCRVAARVARSRPNGSLYLSGSLVALRNARRERREARAR